jgi:glycosyltransferase involved in cell wall biosynthesis
VATTRARANRSGTCLERHVVVDRDDPRRVVTVHNGVAASTCPGAGPGIRTQLGLDPADLVIGMIGILRTGKGHEIATAALARLLERFSHVRLLIVGDGPLRAHVQRLIEPLGPAALAVGHRDDMMAVLDAVDVLVHTSSIDAFPTVLLEAMAAGVPVVATAVGGIPEIVVHDRTGRLHEAPFDAERLAGELVPLVADGETRRLASHGRASRSTSPPRPELGARYLYRSVLR